MTISIGDGSHQVPCYGSMGKVCLNTAGLTMSLMTAFVAGSGKSILWFDILLSFCIPKLISSISSAIIQHVLTLRDAGSASVAYFYFDFRDVDKKNLHNLLTSLLIQLSSQSAPCLKILSHLYSIHDDGKEQTSERVLAQCLKEMLMLPSLSQLPSYVILDALDECPNTSGIPDTRDHVLGFVKDLVDLRLPNLHICVTSRPEIDIRNILESLTPRRISLHDQPGQNKDIAEYINAVVHSDVKMKRWREHEKQLVIETLSKRADGM